MSQKDIIAKYVNGSISDADLFVDCIMSGDFAALEYIKDKKINLWMRYLCRKESSININAFLDVFETRIDKTDHLNIYLARDEIDSDLVIRMLILGWYTDMDIKSYCAQNKVKGCEVFYFNNADSVSPSTIIHALINQYPLSFIERLIEKSKMDKIYMPTSLTVGDYSVLSFHPNVHQDDNTLNVLNEMFDYDLMTVSVRKELIIFSFDNSCNWNIESDIQMYLPHHIVDGLVCVDRLLNTEDVDMIDDEIMWPVEYMVQVNEHEHLVVMYDHDFLTI